MEELEGADVVGLDVCGSQRLSDPGHFEALIKSRGLSSNPHHLPEPPRCACEQQITRKPLLGLLVGRQDFIGVNYYSPACIRKDQGGETYVAHNNSGKKSEIREGEYKARQIIKGVFESVEDPDFSNEYTPVELAGFDLSSTLISTGKSLMVNPSCVSFQISLFELK